MPKSESDASKLIAWLAALGDVARLRILRLLETEELGVGELARIVQLPQSTVSRHLKLLLENGWIARRSEGTASLYRLRDDSLDPSARELWRFTRDQLRASPAFDEDHHRLNEVLAERRTDSKAFFGRIGGEWDQLRQELFGAGFTSEALLGLIDPDWVVADLGCGTGDASEWLAPLVRKVIAIDREPAMLDAARRRLKRFDNVEFREGELTHLPLRASEVDAAVVFLVMHHLPDPTQAVGEIARVLGPGGTLMVVDMVAHDRETFRHTMGHEHLGFEEKDVRRWARAAGLKGVRYRRLRPDTRGKGPGLFFATMRKS